MIFSRQGVPLYLVTDNAQEFCSETFINRLKIGCTPYKTPPYHPQSNGCAERMVRTIKDSMRVWKESFGNFSAYLQKVLMNYRAIPHGGRNESCSKLMGRKIRSPILYSNEYKPMEEVIYDNKRAKVIVQKEVNTYIVSSWETSRNFNTQRSDEKSWIRHIE